MSVAAPSDAPAATERLAYEPLGMAHTVALAAWADPRLYRWIVDPPPSADDIAARIARVTTRAPPAGERWRNWVVRRHGDGVCVGIVEATIYDDAHAHLAYFVFAEFQRHGYAREACTAVIHHLSEHFGVRSIVAWVDTCNVASQRLLEALGFTRDAAAVPTDPIGGRPAWDYCYRVAPAG